MKRDEMIGELLKMQSSITKLLQHLEVMEDELLEREKKMPDVQKIFQAMVRQQADLFELDLLTATDIVIAIESSHETVPGLLRSIGVAVKPRKVTPVKAGILASKLPQAKKFLAVKGKHTIRVWSLKGDYMRYSLVSAADMYNHYHAQMDNFITKKTKIDPPTFL